MRCAPETPSARAVVHGAPLTRESGDASPYRVEEVHHRGVAPDRTDGAVDVHAALEIEVNRPVEAGAWCAVAPLDLGQPVLEAAQAAQEPGIGLRVVVYGAVA